MRVGIHTANPDVDGLAAYCHQLGVHEVFLHASAIPGFQERGYLDRERVASFNGDLMGRWITVSGMIAPVPGEDAVMGKEESEVDRLCWTIRAMGEAGVDRMLFYPLDRTMHIHEFDATAPPVLIPGGRGWGEIVKFFEKVVRAADEAGVKLASHVWDVPLMTAIIDAVPSPNNGVTYCQGMYIIGGDPYKAVADWGVERIFLTHARNLIRHGPKFKDYQEVPLDKGDVDLAKCVALLYQAGYDGMIIPEHLGSAQDTDPMPDAVTYLKGLLSSLIHPTE